MRDRPAVADKRRLDEVIIPINGRKIPDVDRAEGKSHIEALLEDVPRHAGIVTAIDTHPAALAGLGGLAGHRTLPPGAGHFGQTGSIAALYRHLRLDADAIAQTAGGLTPGARLE